MQKSLTKLIADTQGSTSLEYSLLAAALAIGVLPAITSLGDVLGGIYQNIVSGLGIITGFLAG